MVGPHAHYICPHPPDLHVSSLITAWQPLYGLHHRYSNNIHGYTTGTPTISMVTPQVLQQYPWLHLRLPTRSSDGGTNMVMSSVVTCPMSNAHVQHCTVRPHLSAPWIYKRWRGKRSGYARLVPSPSAVVFI